MFKPNTKIMVVDDFKTMRLVVMNALKTLGFTNFTDSPDAADAWPVVEQAAASQEPFELIISDWNMPKMQGIEFLKKVRSLPATKNLPFLMVTAEAEQKNIIEAVQCGVSNYIVKPFAPSALQEKLALIYKKHHS